MDLGGGETALYSIKAAIVAKIYIDSQKYNKVSKSFNFKLTIFKNIYKKASLQLNNYIIAFSIILKELV